jgi:hypothetical protein
VASKFELMLWACNSVKELDKFLDILTKQTLAVWQQWYKTKKKFKTTKTREISRKLQSLERSLNCHEERQQKCAEKLNMVVERLGLVPERSGKPKKSKIKEYADLSYPTPNMFVNKYKGKSALVIGTGVSTEKLLEVKGKLKQKFDVIIGINGAVKDFEDELDFHIVIDRLQVWMIEKKGWFDGEYRKDLPRILNWKSSFRFPQDLNIIKTPRCNFGKKSNIRKFRCANQEGLLTGPLGRIGLSLGTPMTQSIHFAGILGCSKVYLSGADLLFRGEYDHYHGGHLYRNNELRCKPRNKSLLVEVEHRGKKYITVEYFLESAEWMNEVLIPKICKSGGLEVCDFSGGLLLDSIQVNFDKFWKTKYA